MNRHHFTVECEKHGHHWALLADKEKGILRPEDYPEDVSGLRRVCAKCLAEAMVSPVRRSQSCESSSSV